MAQYNASRAHLAHQCHARFAYLKEVCLLQCQRQWVLERPGRQHLHGTANRRASRGFEGGTGLLPVQVIQANEQGVH